MAKNESRITTSKIQKSSVATSDKWLPSEKSFPIVGIGASAGGLEAIQKLVAHLPVDTKMAFVIVQHLERTHESHLAEILSRNTSMPVREITDGMQVEPNFIFVIPSNCDLDLSNYVFNLHLRPPSQRQHMSIDFFFESLSKNQKSNAIGVILSGTATDGTIGLKLIKAAGGTTFAQDPQTAKFDGMPRSAIASGVVDLILPPDGIAVELARMAKHPYTKALPVEPVEDSESEAKDIEKWSEPDEILRSIFSLLRVHTQIDFSQYKPTTVKRRIQRQMMLHKIDTTKKYADYLKSNPEAVKSLYDDIFIHVTEFFRDPDSFRALLDQISPLLTKDRESGTPFRVWVPGCSTGEEAYSLAISLIEFLDKGTSNTQVLIFATDIKESAVQTARKGFYPEFQTRGISEERLKKFFDKVGDGYKIKKTIRDICVFSRHDVTNNPPFAKLDLISCRNVLIYFAPELQKRVIPVFHYALNPDGLLCLGKAESPGASSKLFSVIDKTNKIYSRVTTAGQPRIQFPAGHYVAEKLDAGRKPPGYPLAGLDFQRSADQMLLFKYSPSAVIINGEMEIIQFRGRTAPYLEPSTGLPNHNLLKMAHPDLLSQLRTLVQAAKKQNAPARKDGVSFKLGGKRKTINIEVAPLNPVATPKERQFIVVFEDTSLTGQSKTKETVVTKKGRGKKSARQKAPDTRDQYIVQLQQELDSTREYQQSLIEEYESAQEELTSSNEELQSTNEELQSTNEELGTAKEELQATNEELSSLNDELQKRNVDLNTLNEDLEKSERRFRAMVESVQDYAIFMLDADGKVASWNEGAKRFKGYDAEEIIGQHFSKFYPPEDIQAGKPKNDLETAVSKGRFEDEGWRVRKDGVRIWTSVIITTFYDANRNVLGFAKVTRDLTERRAADEKIRAANESLETRVKEKTQQLEEALKSRDEFLSLASHELKTPLTSLALQIQMTRESIDPKEKIAPSIDKLYRVFEISDKQVKRLTALVEDLLDTSRIQTGKFTFNFEKINLSEILRDMIDRFADQFEKAKCKLETDIQGNVYLIGDHARLEQIVDNLISNVIKYAPERPVKVSLASDQKKATLVVEDHGPGIPKERQTKIFDRYERATAPRKISGLGLGLFITKEVVKGHNGSIEMESDIGKGSKFTVSLPLDPTGEKKE